MIDWVNVAFNALWIGGLAVMLAAFSYHNSLAGETSRRLRDVLSQASWRLPFTLGMLLTRVGFGYGLSERWWKRTIWMVLAISYGFQIVAALFQRQKKTDFRFLVGWRCG